MPNNGLERDFVFRAAKHEVAQPQRYPAREGRHVSEILIAYYSRTGKTRMVAETLAALLGADVDEIRETKSRRGLAGYLGGIKDSMLKCEAELAGQHTLEGRTAVIIGMPVWAASPPPAVRKYLQSVSLEGKKIFGFCTYDSAGGKATLAKLADMVGGELLATLPLKKPDKDSDLEAKLEQFVARIKAVVG
ncbi:MAG: flavodoxin family protein [Planctomycetota bacterium]